MPTPYINTWVTVELIAVQASQKVETVFNYSSDPGIITEGQLLQFVTTWQGAMTGLIQQCLSNEVQLLQVHAKTHFEDVANVEAVWDYPPGTVGTINFECSPGNVSLATKLVTGILGRKWRGRQFWFGIANNQINDNYVGSTQLLRMAQMFTRHLVGFTADGVIYYPAIASRVALAIRHVTGFAIELFLDSQRRRLTGRGK